MSLQDIDGQEWGEPTYPSHLVSEYHRLRKVPLVQLTVEDLRLLIGQPMSLEFLEYLLPIAFEHLLREPWASGDYYEGDLLKNVLSVPASFWYSHPELKSKCDQIVDKAVEQATEPEPQDALLFDAGVLGLLQQWEQTPKL